MVTVALSLEGVDAVRSLVDAARPQHPTLVDAAHQMDSLFGVVNVPSVIWIDEDGVIVRPAEPGWPGPPAAPEDFARWVGDRLAREAEASPAAPPSRDRILELVYSGQDRAAYPDAIRDWVGNGAASRFRLAPEEVIARSRPTPPEVSAAAAHVELAAHLWVRGDRDPALQHLAESHRLQPDNWTYRRQAWSLVGLERVGGDYGRFAQTPLPGEVGDWPFDSDFMGDISRLRPGEYYPDTMS